MLVFVKKNLDLFFSRKAFMIALILECIIKNISYFKYGKHAIYVICGYATLLLIYRLIFYRSLIFNKKLIFGYLFVISAIIPCFIYKFQGLYNDIVMIMIFVTMFFIVSYISDYENEDCIKNEFIFLNNVICILYFIYTIISLSLTFIFGYDRVYGLIEKTDFYSYNCVTVIGCSLFGYLYNNKNNLHKYFHIINILLHFFVIIFTQSRAAFVALIFCLLLYIVIYYKINNIFLIFNIRNTLMVMSLIIILLFVVDKYTNLKFSYIILKIANSGLTGREFIWLIFLDIYIKNNMFFGLSYGAVPCIANEYLGKNFVYKFLTKNNPRYYSIINSVNKGYAHNIYLQQLLSHGILGLIIMILYIFNFIFRYIMILKNKSKNDIFVRSFIFSSIFVVFSQLIMGFFNNNIFFNIVYVSQVFFFYYVGIIYYFYNKITN